jgi:hypothetical protein
MLSLGTRDNLTPFSRKGLRTGGKVFKKKAVVRTFEFSDDLDEAFWLHLVHMQPERSFQ